MGMEHRNRQAHNRAGTGITEDMAGAVETATIRIRHPATALPADQGVANSLPNLKGSAIAAARAKAPSSNYRVGIPQSLACQLLSWIPEDVWNAHGMHPPLEMGKERTYFDRYWSGVSGAGNIGAGSSINGGNLMH